MRSRMKLLLTAFLLGTAIAWAQGPYQAPDPDLLVGLSYERWPGQQICISVSQDGNYHIISPSKTTVDPVRLKGKMADDQIVAPEKDADRACVSVAVVQPMRA